MKNIKDYLIIGLLVLIIFQKECHGPGSGGVGENDTIFLKSEIIYDSTKHYFPVFQPAVKDSFIKEIPANVDTVSILRMFFTEKQYQDQFRDSNIVIDYKATVYMNTLKDFIPSYQILRPKIENKYLVAEHKVKFFGGPTFGFDRSGRFYAGPELILMTKKENLYTADVDLINQGVKFGALWKLSIKSKK